jgi:site-specific DNA-methyltransferase (adenine-specific)
MTEKYQVIYADPPWHYTGFALAKGSDRKDYKKKKKAGLVEHHYEGMSIQELKDLNIDPYQIVYADPPWHFSRGMDKASKGKSKINVDKNYPTMGIQEIKDLEVSNVPIKNMIANDAACFMWTTDTHLPYAIEIMKTWGFTYKTIGFVWVKKTVNNKTVKMLAPWTNKGAELCLFGTKGAMTKHLGANDVFQVHEELRREHSRKPDIIRDEIKRMFPDCKRIELFARTAMPGWDAWGNEVDKFTEPEQTKKGLW